MGFFWWGPVNAVCSDILTGLFAKDVSGQIPHWVRLTSISCHRILIRRGVNLESCAGDVGVSRAFGNVSMGILAHLVKNILNPSLHTFGICFIRLFIQPKSFSLKHKWNITHLQKAGLMDARWTHSGLFKDVAITDKIMYPLHFGYLRQFVFIQWSTASEQNKRREIIGFYLAVSLQ